MTLSLIGQARLGGTLRAVLAIIALFCILGAFFPDSDLIPFRKDVDASRTSQVATQATRWLFLVGACLSAWAFVAWRWIHRGVATGIQSIARWSENFFWGLVWGLALGLRLPVLLFFPTPELRSDALWYHETAIAIAAGQGLQLGGEPTAYRPPGYSTLLALTYRLFGPYPEWAWLWGVVSVGIIVLTTYRLANRFYGKTIARIATLIIAFYPALILYTGQPMSDVVFTAGLMLVCYVIAIDPPYRWLETIGIGVALGLLTLTRSVSIGFFLVVPLLWFIKEANIRKLALHFVLLTCVFTACLMPWMLRNYAIFGTPTLGTNMGLVLYIGNHANASGTFDDVVAPKTSEVLNEAQVDRILLEEASRFVLAHPIHILSILPKKVIHLFLLETNAAQTQFQDMPFWFKYSSYGITQIFYLPLLVLFGIRLLTLTNSNDRPHDIQWLGIIIIAYFTIMAMLFFGMDRYRLPILPWIIIESSVVIAWLGNLRQPGKSPVNIPQLDRC